MKTQRFCAVDAAFANSGNFINGVVDSRRPGLIAPFGDKHTAMLAAELMNGDPKLSRGYDWVKGTRKGGAS